MKKILKKIRKLWISFWGNRYRVFEDDKLINEILIYHKRIYILGKKGKWYKWILKKLI